MAKISVIIPIYNAEKYLTRCILSVFNQTMKDIEILAIDDGSTDKSLYILEKLQKINPKILKIFTKENGGAGSARNIGLKHATGEFIKFVDADDTLEANALEKMYTIAIEKRVLLVRGNYKTKIGLFQFEDKCNWQNINENKIIDLTQNKNYIVTETPGIGNKLIHQKLLENISFPEKTKWEDLAIIPTIIANSEKIFHLNEPIYNYYLNWNTTIKDFVYKISNILDILKCVEQIEEEMKKRNLFEFYQNQIESLAILHILFRIENAMFWINTSHEVKEIVISSLFAILNEKYSNWQENELIWQYAKKDKLLMYTLTSKRFLNSSYLYVSRNQAEKNITKALKK